MLSIRRCARPTRSLFGATVEAILEARTDTALGAVESVTVETLRVEKAKDTPVGDAIDDNTTTTTS